MQADFDGMSGRYLGRLNTALAGLDKAAFDNGVALVADAWRRGAQVIALGNGGSAMIALHFMTDWTKSIPMATGRPFHGRTLMDNIGLVMAWSNDTSYEDLFARQLQTLLNPGDLVIAISGSGNSENVIRAVDHANAAGAVTLGLCGYGGGRLKQQAQHVIWSGVDDMQLSEDIFALFGHVVMQSLCGHL